MLLRLSFHTFVEDFSLHFNWTKVTVSMTLTVCFFNNSLRYWLCSYYKRFSRFLLALIWAVITSSFLSNELFNSIHGLLASYHFRFNNLNNMNWFALSFLYNDNNNLLNSVRIYEMFVNYRNRLTRFKWNLNWIRSYSLHFNWCKSAVET